MSDMNSIGAIVKILETPKEKFVNSSTLVTICRVQLSQVRKIRTVKLVIWGNLARSVLNYYKINDYVLIEGYISLQSTMSSNETKKPVKKVILTALKVYPFLLDSNGSINKFS
jgi:single-stranded DNA-binding protein